MEDVKENNNATKTLGTSSTSQKDAKLQKNCHLLVLNKKIINKSNKHK